jgi:quercetin dioxygenase-like cupin family protein
MSIVRNKSGLKPLDVNFEAYKLYMGENAELIQIHLKAGECIPFHKNEKEMVFFVIKGEGKLKIENEEFSLLEGDCVNVDSGKDREWINKSEKVLNILAFKLK